ncbi:MAG: hypothetical protein IJI36_01565 [Kiritimatiellae bacterium]|nr:hypothetical protein [Kiritimatiellia bacterium]
MENTEVDKPAWGVGMFALLCVLSLIPIIGLVVGLVNVKHKPRMRQARALIIIGVVSLIFNARCIIG